MMAFSLQPEPPTLGCKVKTDAKSVFLRPDSDKAWYGSDPMKVYKSSFTNMYSKLSLRQLKKSLTLAMLATG
ncbi:hypothetical protein [Escherichia coli]|uniref:hypothetical protein n=1 Tax=Escherichia coli TaxID=562 RepID=UPI0035716125